MRASVVYALVILGLCTLLIISNHSSRPQRPHRRLIVRTFNHSRDPQKSSQAPPHNIAFDPIIAEIESRRERQWERIYFQEQYRRWAEQHNVSDHAENVVEGDHSHHGNQGSLNHDVSPNHEVNPNHEVSPNHEVNVNHGGFNYGDLAPGEEYQPTPWDDDHDPEDYLNDDHYFNISKRLEVLFPQLDVDPKDGYVSLKELQDWHVKLNEKMSKQRTANEFAVRDKNHDGLVSLQEYLPHLSIDELFNASGSTETGHAAWWKEQFELADVDGKGGLNRSEFNDFLHPEDSHNPKLHKWLRQEQIRENDHNKDGKLSMDEFDHIFDLMRYYGTDLGHLHRGSDADSRKRMFQDLDRNNDGYITEDELEPVMDQLHPGESFYARQQAQSSMQQADSNGDGHLSLGEMLEHPYVFYSTAYSEHDDVYDDDVHDEFR